LGLRKPTIAVVCVFGAATGRMLQRTVQAVLRELDLDEITVEVTDLESLFCRHYDIAFCMGMLETVVRSRHLGQRVYPVRNVFDTDHIKKCILEQLPDTL
jgi:galactitol-specific phosphotransferase system IIB component